ncbi:MAG: DUF411 domain-containing protein [Gemmatimonadota bacterium]
MSRIGKQLTSAALVLSASLLVLGCGVEGRASDTPSDESPSVTAMQEMQTEGAGVSAAPDDAPAVLVYKAPTCGCCEGWIEHLRENGYEVTVEDRDDVDQVKDLLGIPGRLRSCHTAQIGNYLVEGHVPASDIRRLLEEQPQVAGISVPGMPVGSPGMEVPGRAPDSYDVLAFDADGRTSVFASH